MDTDTIAEACHEANRVLQRALGDPVNPPWLDLDEETRESARDGVVSALAGASPRESHANWLRFKEAHGWAYGPTKSVRDKTHPCMVPYDALPAEQRTKDRLFVAIVRALGA